VANGSVALWFSKLLGRDEGPGLPESARPPARRLSGFADAANLATLPERPVSETSYRPSADASYAPPRTYPLADAVPAFTGTGAPGHRRRIHEKLPQLGPDALADYELLEMLLVFAQPGGDTKPLAKAMINRFGSFAGVLSAGQAELFDTPGLSKHSIAALKLVQASALRLAKAEVMDRPVLTNWGRLMDYLNAVMSREKIEQFRVLYLDNRNRLLADEAQARGTVNHTPVYPREVVRRALELHATALILVHNHPSGDPTPSREDVAMTEEVRAAAAVLSIVLHDHVIVGNGQWTSFRKEGLL
jgi:DNA repair protein RadC